jgi:proline-specific peptidase
MYEQEGTLSFRGHDVWFRSVGEGRDGRLPLLILHGGPGATHRYLASLSDLADGRRVVFYDQIGCGRSAHPADPDFYSAELFVEELATVRDALGLRDVFASPPR